MTAFDPYEILGIARTATDAQIRKAYRRKAAMHHPDADDSPDAAEIFRQIKLAHDLLLDRDKRRIYDETGNIEEAQESLADTIKGLQQMFEEIFTSEGEDGDPIRQLHALLDRNEGMIVNARLPKNRKASEQTTIIRDRLVFKSELAQRTTRDFLRETLDRYLLRLEAERQELEANLKMIMDMRECLLPYGYDLSSLEHRRLISATLAEYTGSRRTFSRLP